MEGDRQKADEFLRLDAAIRKKQYVLYQTHIAHSAVNVEKASSKHRLDEQPGVVPRATARSLDSNPFGRQPTLPYYPE